MPASQCPDCSEIDRLRADHALNASMLARQTDLAREAETEAARLRAENDTLREALMDIIRNANNPTKNWEMCGRESVKFAKMALNDGLKLHTDLRAENDRLRAENIALSDEYSAYKAGNHDPTESIRLTAEIFRLKREISALKAKLADLHRGLKALVDMIEVGRVNA